MAKLCRHRKRETTPLPSLEIHIAHSCNLHCESCSHYANQGHREIAIEDETVESKNQPTSVLTRGRRTGHASTTDEVRQRIEKELAKRELQLSRDRFFCNGTPICPMALRDTNTCLCLSIHHCSPQYQEQFQPDPGTCQKLGGQPRNSAAILPLLSALDEKV